jgi:hypothetical protein
MQIKKEIIFLLKIYRSDLEYTQCRIKWAATTLLSVLRREDIHGRQFELVVKSKIWGVPIFLLTLI